MIRRIFLTYLTGLVASLFGADSIRASTVEQPKPPDTEVTKSCIWVFEVHTCNGKHFIGSVDAVDVNEADKILKSLPKLKDESFVRRILRADYGPRCWETQW